MNDQSLNKKLKQLDQLSALNEQSQCIELCNRFIAEQPDEPSLLRKKADLLEDFGLRDDAYQARLELISLGHEEPADFYDLTLLAWGMEKFTDCIEWASKTISACKKHERSYYLQAGYFFKAVAETQIGRFEDALQSCQALEDNYETHVSRYGMISKEEIIQKSTNKQSWG